MFKKLRIKIWKRKLRLRYLNYVCIKDTLSCGNALANVVSATYRECKEEVNVAICKLKELDPTCTLEEIE